MNIADIAAIVNGAGGGGGNAGGGGGGYDFVIANDVTTSSGIYSLASGDFDKVAAKLQNHELVTGCMFNFDSNVPSVKFVSILESVEFLPDDNCILTTWRMMATMSSKVYIVWTRDGNIFED